MAASPFSVRAIVLEQTERIRRSSKADIQRWIEESESNLISLESQIAALVELRDRERATVAALRHIISPIHALPVELLVEIFGLAIRDHYCIEDALRISQVCSDWRHVAHSTPRLWSHPIHVDLKSRVSDQAYADGLKAWLARSAPLLVPLSVSFEHNISPRISEEVLRIAPRWRSFQINPEYTSASFIKRVAECRLDSLEELVLKYIERDVPNLEPIVFSAPRLRKLTMDLYPESQRIVVRWAQLTDLTLNNSHSPESALDILGRCLGLVQASVTTTGWPQLPQAKTNFLALNHLRCLSLAFYRTTHFMPFLDRLSVPALEELELEFGNMNPTQSWMEAHFTAFQQRSPHIRRLELSYSNLTSGDLKAALRHAPHLTRLELTCCDDCFDDALICALYYKDGVEPLVPRLHSLFLRGMEGNEFTEDILAGMIASRWWPDAELPDSAPRAVTRWTQVHLGSLLDNCKDILPPNVLI